MAGAAGFGLIPVRPVGIWLGAYNQVIHEVLERLDEALVATVAEPKRVVEVREAVDLLTLRLHLSYEERELVEPMARIPYHY